jgi:hypothetical protein
LLIGPKIPRLLRKPKAHHVHKDLPPFPVLSQFKPVHTLTFHFLKLYFNTSRDSSVGIATGYGLDDLMIRARFPAGDGNFSLLYCVQPPIQWVRGVLSLRVKRPGLEADHSPPSSAEVKECVELYFHSSNTSSWRGA